MFYSSFYLSRNLFLEYLTKLAFCGTVKTNGSFTADSLRSTAVELSTQVGGSSCGKGHTHPLCGSIIESIFVVRGHL